MPGHFCKCCTCIILQLVNGVKTTGSAFSIVITLSTLPVINDFSWLRKYKKNNGDFYASRRGRFKFFQHVLFLSLFFSLFTFFSQFGCNPSKDNLRHLFQFFWQYSVLSFDEKFYEASHSVWSLQLDILTLKTDIKSLPSPLCGWSCCCRCGCWWWPRLSPWSCPPSSPPPPLPPPQCCPGPRISSACFPLYWSHSSPYSLDSREPKHRKLSDMRDEREERDERLTFHYEGRPTQPCILFSRHEKFHAVHYFLCWS